MNDRHFLYAGLTTGLVILMFGVPVWQGVLIALPNLVGWVWANN